MQNTWWLSYIEHKNVDSCGKVTVKATIIIPVIRASLQLRGESLHWSGHNFSVAQSTQSAAQPSLTALPEQRISNTESPKNIGVFIEKLADIKYTNSNHFSAYSGTHETQNRGQPSRFHSYLYLIDSLVAEDKNNATSDSIRPTTSRERGKEAFLNLIGSKISDPLCPVVQGFFMVIFWVVLQIRKQSLSHICIAAQHSKSLVFNSSLLMSHLLEILLLPISDSFSSWHETGIE